MKIMFERREGLIYYIRENNIFMEKRINKDEKTLTFQSNLFKS